MFSASAKANSQFAPQAQTKNVMLLHLCAPRVAAALAIALIASNAIAETPTRPTVAQKRVRSCFDANWRFIKQDVKDAQAVDFDHSSWRTLGLPHDWSVEGPFDQKAKAGAPGGYLPNGIGWYRKTFEHNADDPNQKTVIEFDGVYKNSEVWINGHALGKRPFGYIGFEYDLTPHLVAGENVISVRVDNSLQPSSRWYTGSGIYRHVWLIQTSKTHIAHWGTQVRTPVINQERAVVNVLTTVQNDFDVEKVLVIQQTIGNQKVSKEITLAPNCDQVVEQSLEIKQPKLWSPGSPSLYQLTTEVLGDQQVVDQYQTSFGVRKTKFDPDKGFFLNGQSLILKGMCNHSDLGPLGVALWDDALERRLIMLKEMGCNAIRTAHNPSSPELLEMCDRLGFFVINETFDKWRYGWKGENGRLVANTERPAVRHGYHLHIDQWWQTDLTAHVKRDRNHPSVIMWSVANEVPEAQKYGELETLKAMRDLCHELDPTRPVTAGVNQIAEANVSGFANELDAVGYNGGGGSCFQYEADHLQFPKRFIYASEVPHSLQTRGEYRTRSRYREKKHQPDDLTTEELFPETHNKYESSYDNAGVRISARDSWRLTKTLPYVAGEFRWTGFDYIGESGGWPRVLGNFGIIDLGNFPKDTFYFYQSQWTDKPMVHLLPHWTWPGKDGVEIPVWCYSNCDSVELFLNGKSLGSKSFGGENDMHLQWMVPYQAGQLKAVATKDGKVIATALRKTAGSPTELKLVSDRDTLSSNIDPNSPRKQLAFLTISAHDENGTLAPKAALDVDLKITGPGRILAVCNGDPIDSAGYQREQITTFNGLARVIVAGTGEAGIVTLTATAKDLPSVTVSVEVN